MFIVDEEDEGHSLLVYPHGQGTKIGAYGLPLILAYIDKRSRGDYWR